MNIKFVCDKCIEKYQRNKQSNRRSTSFDKHRLSAPSLENESKNRNKPDKNNESTSPSSLTSAGKSNSIDCTTIEAEPLDNNSNLQPKSSDAALHNALLMTQTRALRVPPIHILSMTTIQIFFLC